MWLPIPDNRPVPKMIILDGISFFHLCKIFAAIQLFLPIQEEAVISRTGQKCETTIDTLLKMIGVAHIVMRDACGCAHAIRDFGRNFRGVHFPQERRTISKYAFDAMGIEWIICVGMLTDTMLNGAWVTHEEAQIHGRRPYQDFCLFLHEGIAFCE